MGKRDSNKEDKMDSRDKDWARKYLLDPLIAPEPNQDNDSELSHYQKLKQRASVNYNNGPSSPDHVSSQLNRLSLAQSRDDNSKRPDHSSRDNTSSSGILTPPSSASPTRGSFHPSNPYSRYSASNSQRGSPPPYLSPPTSPPRGYGKDRPHNHRSHSSQSVNRQPQLAPPDVNVQRSTSVNGPPQRKTHYDHRRIRSLNERFPGDMSHRPLDVLRAENRKANRSTPLNPSGSRHRRNISETDQIDALDSIGPGGPYHHGGPFDAAMTSRNLDERYAPLAAVRDSNNEAIKATPREYIQDSLIKHRPLQGTSVVPSGGRDMSGNVMEYEEGMDMMREEGAIGGAYKRWEGFQYHPDDLKGKGEPSYTYEEDLKRREHLLSPHKGSEYEMQPGKPRMHHRRSSYNNASDGVGSSSGNALGADDLRRSHSTGGKKLSDGLKRRFGSIRRKNRLTTEEVH